MTNASSNPYSFIVSEASERVRHAEGDQAHVRDIMALGGFQTRVAGVLMGMDGRPWRPGVPLRLGAKPAPVAPPPVRASTRNDMFRRRIAMLRVLEGGHRSALSIAGALNLTPDQARKTLSRMDADRLVEVESRGGAGVPSLYAITDSGRRVVASQNRA